MKPENERNAFRYKVKLGNKIIQKGWAFDLNRRRLEVVARYSGAIVKQVGRKVTPEEAERWLRGGKL